MNIKKKHIAKKNGVVFCPLCSSIQTTITILPYPLFRHMDFSPFHPGPNRIAHCGNCGLVFRIVTDEEMRSIDNIYISEAYREHEEPHMVIVKDSETPLPSSHVQAGLVRPFLRDEHPAILDIGCFDGRLLIEISKICDASDLCGYDVGGRPQFPKDPIFRFVSGDMGLITGTFDMIIMSHSIQYINDIHLLFEQIRQLLRPGGQLFIQAPDFSAKPSSLLFGDLYYHYTPLIMNNMLRYLGFNVQRLDNTSFPRDILLMAMPAAEGQRATFGKDLSFNDSLAEIFKMVNWLQKIGKSERLGILGTTIDASFSAYCMGSNVAFFVDENHRKTGKLFQGRPVIHPNSVKTNDMIVIPMGETGKKIRERFLAQYKGTYLCL
jgi:SAM-dependent methyltransferase